MNAGLLKGLDRMKREALGGEGNRVFSRAFDFSDVLIHLRSSHGHFGGELNNTWSYALKLFSRFSSGAPSIWYLKGQIQPMFKVYWPRVLISRSLARQKS